MENERLQLGVRPSGHLAYFCPASQRDKTDFARRQVQLEQQGLLHPLA